MSGSVQSDAAMNQVKICIATLCLLPGRVGRSHRTLGISASAPHCTCTLSVLPVRQLVGAHESKASERTHRQCSAGPQREHTSLFAWRHGPVAKKSPQAACLLECVQVANPFEDGTFQGPQVDTEQFDKVMKYIKLGSDAGAKLLCGGQRKYEEGYFVEPTIFANVSDDMDIARDEIFGPVRCMYACMHVTLWAPCTSSELAASLGRCGFRLLNSWRACNAVEYCPCHARVAARA